MDLLNATGEVMRWNYDAKPYEFPPNELVRVSDPAGKLILKHLAMKGLQEVKYGDDPLQISFRAINSIVTFHKRQIDDHERANEIQAEKKFPPLIAPPSVKLARRALKTYGPIYDEMRAKVDGEADDELARKIKSSVSTVSEMPDVTEMTLEDLRSTLKKLGGEGGTANRKTLLSRIRKLTGNIEIPEE